VSLASPGLTAVSPQEHPFQLRDLLCRRNKVVISPHVYPPTITTATVAYSGASLNQRLTLAHGYLNKVGYCKPGIACKTFPIVIGEFGTKLTDARDLQMMPQVRVMTGKTAFVC
jgi:hypothetical protein